MFATPKSYFPTFSLVTFFFIDKLFHFFFISTLFRFFSRKLRARNTSIAILGFVLECLKVYNFQADEVISAILEENLPPHLVDIPFDEIRIPPETSPSRPKLEEIKGKKSNYDDALKLLNDKKDVKQIKTFILDGM